MESVWIATSGTPISPQGTLLRVGPALQADIRRLGDRLVTWLDSHS